ncbi:MAG: YbhB/YbcL family Raf kinase inhibitor-like protein [Anaerolineae bacterium]
MIGRMILLFGVVAWLVGCGGTGTPAPTAAGAAGGMQLTSPAFAGGAAIPDQYTCSGADISPPLAWSNVPAGARSLALICDDPDAPLGTWVHWVLFNLPPSLNGLPEGVPARPTLEGGGVHGTNSWQRIGYGGPCPPGGTHRYYFKLYALDTTLSLDSRATAKEVQAAMQGHVLGTAQLMGRYSRR